MVPFAALPAAVLLGAAVVLLPVPVLLCVVVLALAAVVWWRPVVAAYGLIGVTPLVAGIDRGGLIPVLRPSEVLLLLFGGTLALRAVVRWRGAVRLPRPNRVEVAILLLAVTSSILPLAWMGLIQREISRDDILHALVLWKYLFVYAIVRYGVGTEAQVRRCLWLSLAAAGVVGLIGVLEALGIFGVQGMLVRFYDLFGASDRELRANQASSTLSLPGATADLMILNLAVARGLWVRTSAARQRMLLAAAFLVFVFGALAAGEFSSTIGLFVGIVAVAFVSGAPGLTLLAIPGSLLAYPILRPVIERRLSGFQSASGVPASWVGRLNNLRTYFWPELFSRWNFVLGVRPSARVPVSSQITGYVWIESGYTWLLWGGGIPLLCSFLWFANVVARAGWRAARDLTSARGAAATGAFAGIAVIVVLMAFDPHLTYRGSADAFFGLLALAGLGGAARDDQGGA